MTDIFQPKRQIDEVATLLREKLGVKGQSFDLALRRAKHRLPRRVYREGMVLARAEALSAHPRLACTIDQGRLDGAARVVTAHLTDFDPGEARKTWWLGVLGGLAFNILLFGVLIILFVLWRQSL
ncbi:hypothetical protein ACFORG_15385 [Lutimaribacter marinistellae]|uniref:Uncharacterized protein n=1 Tax=Lutimaribacter marinistellae TaxID=1820329 RepID=A0ABV7THR5_9RHOB